MKPIAIAAVSVAAIMLAGCSTVLDGIGSSKTPVAEAEITPAPTGSVESSAVPAPAPVYGAAATTADAAVTPRAAPTPAATSVALNNPPGIGGTAYADAGATRSQLAGTWTYSWEEGHKNCPVTLSTDRGMSGMSASADVSCPNDIFMTKGWDVLGNDIVLQNHVGKVTARLQPAGPGRFDGVATGDGSKVTLTRS